MDLRLKGKLAVVTGASKGIGRAVAGRLAAEGCALIIVSRTETDLKALAEDLAQRFGVPVRHLALDLSRPAAQDALIAQAGEADILVNNAGSNPAGTLAEISEQVWRASWDLKLFSYVNLTRGFYERMKQRGNGVIVNVIGNSGERMNARYVLGSSGNSALMALTRALGGRSPDDGIRVVGLNPGLIATDRAEFMLKGWSQSRFGTPDRAQEVLDGMDLPFGRMGTAEEVGDTVAFLASPLAGYISGTIVTVDGGAANRN